MSLSGRIKAKIKTCLFKMEKKKKGNKNFNLRCGKESYKSKSRMNS